MDGKRNKRRHDSSSINDGAPAPTSACKGQGDRMSRTSGQHHALQEDQRRKGRAHTHTHTRT
eukprot:117672-Alexandrium_andersonii.AAC.1